MLDPGFLSYVCLLEVGSSYRSLSMWKQAIERRMEAMTADAQGLNCCLQSADASTTQQKAPLSHSRYKRGNIFDSTLSNDEGTITYIYAVNVSGAPLWCSRRL